MDQISVVSVLLIAIAGTVLLFWLAYRIRAGHRFGLRPIGGFAALRIQNGVAVESGRSFHFSPGRASLAGQANPTSVAALSVLDYLTETTCAGDVPPITTSGDGSLLLAVQDSLRNAYATAGRSQDYSPQMAQYVAAEDQPMTYAAGASDVVNRGNLGSNLMIGRFGSEIAVVAEAAERGNMDQVIGSDDPTSLAVAAAVTEDLLLGEEMFAAGAYLHGEPAQIASLQLQDILRVIAIAGLLLAALINIVVA